jgi:phage repressor protein C with HTH and peptisase S24 domain
MLDYYDKRSVSASGATILVADKLSARRHPYGVLSSDDLLAKLRKLRAAGETTNAAIQRLLGLPSSRVSEIFAGTRRIQADEAKVLIEHFGLSEGARPIDAKRDSSTTPESLPIEMVGIRYSDADFGLGAVFTDEVPQIELLQFPRAWVESITYTSPMLLSWVRARGSSMKPTINDGDMILLDHSKRKVEEQDDIWAFTVGETRAIKRLRVKGDRYQILSDNPAIPPDEEPIDFVNIVGRVIFVGSRT